MKKHIIWLFTLLACLTGALSSCSDDDIVFDHELPAFPTQADKVLFEVILPTGTSADDDIYIAGAFNGQTDSSVIGKDEWKLNLKDSVTGKRGIYLDPTTFVNGKTLADGYHFVSAQQRNEVTALNDTVIRTQNPGVGTRTNIYVSKWAAYFAPAPTKKHNGHVVYVDNQTGWDDLYLYMWGDVNDLGGAWPGFKSTGTEVINGITYTYFDMGSDNNGLTEHLIFNNGSGTQLADFAYTIDHDVYLKVTAAGVEELNQETKHDGFVVYVKNDTGWDDLYLYQWGEVNDLGGAWPGATATGTETINGQEYLYFDMGEANTGLKQHLIFNSGAGQQLADYDYTIDHDVYLDVTASGVKEINPTGDTPDTPQGDTFKIYIDNQTGWSDFTLYVYGDKELFGGWPGAKPSGTETINGVTYQTWEIGNDASTYTPIFNNNGGGSQIDGKFTITATQNYYFQVSNDGWKEVKP